MKGPTLNLHELHCHRGGKPPIDVYKKPNDFTTETIGFVSKSLGWLKWCVSLSPSFKSYGILHLPPRSLPAKAPEKLPKLPHRNGSSATNHHFSGAFAAKSRGVYIFSMHSHFFFGWIECCQDTNGSQFFILFKPAHHLNGARGCRMFDVAVMVFQGLPLLEFSTGSFSCT